MRLDADIEKSGVGCAAVFVDGVQSMGCVMADEELGVVEEEDLSGPWCTWDDSLPRGRPTRMRWGKVEIRAVEGMEEQFERLKEWKRLEAEALRLPQ